MMPRCDVVVIGAGPAGSAFAFELATAGFEVVVLERGAPGRDKVCGEGVQLPGVGVLERMGVFHAAWEAGAPFQGIRFEAGRRAVKLALAGIAIARTVLDDIVAQAAAQAGAQIRWRAAAVELRRDGSQWVVRDAEGTEWCAMWVVGADGAHSWLRRRLAVGVKKTHNRAGLVFHTDDAMGEPFVRVFCERDYEVYTTPVGGRRRLVAWLGPAARLAAERRNALRRGLEKRLAMAGLTAELDEGASMAPLNSQSEQGAGPGWLLVGDAAGQVDPILGMGISGALTSGITAAHAVRAALHTRTGERVDSYAKNQSRRLRWSVWLADAVLAASRRPGLWPAINRMTGALPDLPETVARYLFPDEMEYEYALPNLRPLCAHQP